MYRAQHVPRNIWVGNPSDRHRGVTRNSGHFGRYSTRRISMQTKAFVAIMDVAIFPSKFKEMRGRAKPGVIGHGTNLRRKLVYVAG